jgi:hypothetical protein
MSIAGLRDAFNAVTLPQVRCTAARLSYCDSSGSDTGPRNHQRIAFDYVKPADNSSGSIQSDPLPPGTNITATAQALARTAIGTNS